MNGIGSNRSLQKLTIKLSGIPPCIKRIESNLHAAIEEVVFTDRSEELCSALDNAFSKNKTLIEVNLINLRFCGRLIDCIGKGLKVNKSVKMLSMQGNLMV